MHELSVVRELLKLAAEKAPPPCRVREVRVNVGRLTGVSPEAMRFYFEALCEETLGRAATLHIDLCPLEGRCASCGYAVTLEDPNWLCPACARPTIRFENGDELDLESLVVDE